MREPSGRRRPSRGVRPAAGAAIVLLVAIALGGCSGGSNSKATATTSTTKPPSRTTGTTRASDSAALAFLKSLQALGTTTTTPLTIPPGGCPTARTPTVDITVNESGIAPRCISMTVTQSLEIRNTGTLLHNVTIVDLSANVDAGEVQPYGRIGRYLTPGVYGISSSSDPAAAFSGTLVVKS